MAGAGALSFLSEGGGQAEEVDLPPLQSHSQVNQKQVQYFIGFTDFTEIQNVFNKYVSDIHEDV